MKGRFPRYNIALQSLKKKAHHKYSRMHVLTFLPVEERSLVSHYSAHGFNRRHPQPVLLNFCKERVRENKPQISQLKKPAHRDQTRESMC
jgi:hypothetical protein